MKLHGRRTSATVGTAEEESTTCTKNTRSNSGSSGSLSSGVGGGRDTSRDSASRRPRRTRRRHQPTRSQSGYTRHNSNTVMHRTGSFRNRRSHPSAGGGTVQDRKIASLGGMNMALLAEAFAYADRVASDEASEAGACNSNPKKALRRDQQHMKRNAQQGETLATDIGAHHHGEHHLPQPTTSSSIVAGLRRTQSMGAASTITNTTGVSSLVKFDGGPGGERRKKDPATAAMSVALGSKYDTDSIHSSRRTENWLTRSTGGKEEPSFYSGATPHCNFVEGHRRPVGGGSDRSNHHLLNMENVFLVTPRTKTVKGQRRTRKQGMVVSTTKQDAFLHRRNGGCDDVKYMEEISVRSPPEKSGSMNRSDGKNSGRDANRETSTKTTAQLVERFQTGAGIAELRAELENSQASMRRSAEAIKQAASRWHRPSAYP